MSAGVSQIIDDDYEHYNYEDIRCGNSGKNRSKLEAALHTNQNDPCGHTRKIVNKLHNTLKKRELKK